IAGRALVTTVLDSIATNIASSSPVRASMISRCDIWPACSALRSTVGSTLDASVMRGRLGSLDVLVDDVNLIQRWLIPSTFRRVGATNQEPTRRDPQGHKSRLGGKVSDPQAWSGWTAPGDVPGSPAGRVAALNWPAARLQRSG